MRSLSAHEIAISMGRTGLSPNVAIRTVLDNMSKTVGARTRRTKTTRNRTRQRDRLMQGKMFTSGIQLHRQLFRHHRGQIHQSYSPPKNPGNERGNFDQILDIFRLVHIADICILNQTFRCLAYRKRLKLTKNPILAFFENIIQKIQYGFTFFFSSAYINRNLLEPKST